MVNLADIASGFCFHYHHLLKQALSIKETFLKEQNVAWMCFRVYYSTSLIYQNLTLSN